MWNGVLPYLLQLLGPLASLLLLAAIGPCIVNRLVTFIWQQIQQLEANPLQVHYQWLALEDTGVPYDKPTNPCPVPSWTSRNPFSP